MESATPLSRSTRAKPPPPPTTRMVMPTAATLVSVNLSNRDGAKPQLVPSDQRQKMTDTSRAMVGLPMNAAISRT